MGHKCDELTVNLTHSGQKGNLHVIKESKVGATLPLSFFSIENALISL